MVFQNVIKATVLAQKKADITDEEFSRRFALHGNLAAPVMAKYNIISYIQQHALAKYETAFKEAMGPGALGYFEFMEADGIITVVFPTMDDLKGFFLDPAHAETLNADVAEFATLGSVRIAIGDENVVVRDGKTVA